MTKSLNRRRIRESEIENRKPKGTDQMKITIVNARKRVAKDKNGNDVQFGFFAVTMTEPVTGETIVIDNFKIADDHLYPPQKAGKNWYYDTVAISPKLAYRIAAAYREQIQNDLPMDAGDTLIWSLEKLGRIYEKHDVRERIALYMEHIDEEGNPHVRL